jgi:hypothetical protein
MTDGQINKTIAEHCGWEWTNVNPKYGVQDTKFWCNAKEEKIVYWDDQLPDYCNDLNAMHEAEELLTSNEWEVWHRIVGNWDVIVARLTSRQRAEAFLKTIGKWEE